MFGFFFESGRQFVNQILYLEGFFFLSRNISFDLDTNLQYAKDYHSLQLHVHSASAHVDGCCVWPAEGSSWLNFRRMDVRCWIGSRVLQYFLYQDYMDPLLIEISSQGCFSIIASSPTTDRILGFSKGSCWRWGWTDLHKGLLTFNKCSTGTGYLLANRRVGVPPRVSLSKSTGVQVMQNENEFFEEIFFWPQSRTAHVYTSQHSGART